MTTLTIQRSNPSRALLMCALLTSLIGCGSETTTSAATDGGTDGVTLDSAGGDGSSADSGADSGTTDDGAGSDAGEAAKDGGSDDATAGDAAAGDAAAGDAAAGDAMSGDAGSPSLRPFTAQKIEIAGLWQSNFGGNERLTDATWTTPFGAASVVKFDNDKRVLFAQNAKDDQYNPSKFSKLQWTAPKQSAVGGFQVWTTHYCIVDFGLDSLALAEQSTKTANDGAPEKSGCAGFAWTTLTALETVGQWQTNFGSGETINRQAWGYAWLEAFDNSKNVAYSRNPDDAKFGPGTWNKIVWTQPVAGKWHFCTVDFGLDSLAAAQKTSKTADDTDLTGKGCGGFSWTAMTAK